MLEWLGDVGGLFDGLGIVANIVIGPFASFALKAELLNKFFRLSSSKDNKSYEIPRKNILQAYLSCS